MTKDYDTISATPFGSYLGAEISGINVSDCSDEQIADLKTAFVEHGVVVIRDQTLSPDQHVEFAQRIGDINVNRFFKASDENEQIAEVRKEPHQKKNIGAVWHTDHSYDQKPALGSILYAKELPPIGGDTLFNSMHAAWDALSDGLKLTLSTLRAEHSSRHVFGRLTAEATPDLEGRILNAEEATQDATHPVVIRHPQSGKEILYVNPQFTVGIEGWNKDESDALLGFLYQHSLKPEFSCRLRWAPGTIAMWDNRATWHCALNDYQGHRRLLHRITLEGVELEAAAA